MSPSHAIAAPRGAGRRHVVPIVAVVAVAMLGAVLTLAASAPGARAQLSGTTCYTVNDGPGTMVGWTSGSPTDLGSTGLSAVEALASNQDRNELWTFDADSGQMYTFAPGSATPTSEFSFTSGDLDALTWVNHNNGDPSDDQLWGTYRQPFPSVNDGPNVNDQIVRIDPASGAILSGPTDIFDPGAGTNNEQDDNDGLFWDPQTGNVYGVIGGDSTANDLIIIDPTDGSISQISLTLNGGDILDIESLGGGTDGQLYGTTGEDGPDANQFISINKLTGAVTVIGDLSSFGADFEATACLSEEPFSVTPATCYTIDEGNGSNDNHLVAVDIAADGSFTFTDLGVVNNGAGVDARNIESLAYRNGAEPRAIYTQDPATNSLIRINIADGTDTQQVAVSNIGDIDGLTWRFDNDTDPDNDELWGIERRTGSPNQEDRIVQIDPLTGALIGSPVVVQTNGNGAQNDVDGLAWDPATGLFFAPVNGTTSNNELITIDPTTGDVTVIGLMGIQDVEGLGFTDAGELFGMTGADGAEPNLFLFIDKATGQATRLGPITLYADYESFDCAGVAPVLQPDLEIRLDVVPQGDPCPIDFASATDGVGTPLPVQVGDDVTYCFKVINNGPGDAQNVTVNHPALGTPISLGDIPAGGEAMDMVDDVVEIGDGETTATVDGEDLLGVPVPQDADPAAVVIVDDPVLDIRLDVVPQGDPCPVDFASATEGVGTPLPVAVGDDVTYCFKVINNGPGDATNVTIDHPALPGPVNLGDVPAGGEAMDMVDDVVEIGDGETTATVDGENTLGDPVPQAEDPAAVVIVDQPVLDIRLDVVPQGDPCPVDYASATEGVGTPLPVAVGDDVTYCFKVINNGPGDATNVTIDHPALPGPVNLGDIPAGGEAMDMIDDVVEIGDGETTATVDGDDTLGNPVPQAEDPAAVEIVDDPVLDIRLDVVPQGDPCPVDFASATEGVGPVLPVAVGDDVTYCFKVINNGPGDAQNVTIDHPALPGPVNLGDIPAGGEAMDMIDDVVEIGDGETTATVDGENTLGEPVPQAEDPAAVDPVQDPVLDIRLDVVPQGDPCPVDYASATEGVGTPLPVAIGDDVTYCFKVINTGPDTATNVTINHPALPGPVNLGDIPAGGEAMDMIDDVVELGDGETTATVDGQNRLGDPVPQAEDPAAVDPAAPVATIGNFVWEDENRDGIQDPTEPGIEGVTVVVYTALPNGDIDVVVDTLLTDENGEWTLDVEPGDYRVFVAQPSGAESYSPQDQGGDDTLDSDVIPNGPETGFTDVYTVANGDVNLTIDAGIVYPVVPAELGNFVWQDLNGDGIQDSGEPGIQGVVVLVREDGSGNLVGSDTTDANGEWLVTVDPGTYVVQFIESTAGSFTTQDAGVDDTVDSDVDPGTGVTDPVTVGEGESNLTIDAGIVFPTPAIGLAKELSSGPTRIGTTDEYDVSYSFVIENLGDVTLTGVALTDNVAAGLVGTTGSVVDGPIPNASGTCSTAVVDGSQTLIAGESCVAVWDFVIANPGGAELAWDNSASVEGTPPSGPPVTDTSDDGIEPDTDGDGNGDEPGENDPTPALIPALASLGDKVWEDTNENGLDDDGTNGIEGVTVELRDSSGTNVLDTDVTDVDGIYGFTGLDAGTYVVRFVEPADRDFTTQDTGGDDTIDSDADPTTGTTAPVTLAAGEANPTIDAGLTPMLRASLGDYVWEDTNGDGIQDVGEPPVEGVVVNLYDGTGGDLGLTDTTDAAGLYGFDDLEPGDYIVEFIAPAGREFTLRDTPGDDTADSDVDPITGRTGVITLDPGEDDPTNDAGILPVGSISDLVFEDLNGNGIQDAGEPGVEGVTVELLDGTASPIDSTTTDVNGLYSFDDLPEGDYIVEFTPPTGRELTLQDQGGDDGADSDPDPTTNQTDVITLGLGEDDDTVDAGIAPLLASLGDYVWEDLNGDGIQDAGEPPVEGVLVTLLDGSGSTTGQTDTTDASGLYGFDDLLAGDYIVEFEAPAGREFTLQDQGVDDAADSDVDPATSRTGVITLDPGENDPTNDAGIAPLLGSISDLVFDDLDGDGIQDGGEPGVENVTVNLLDDSGNQLDTTTTDANGNYIFGDLLADDYIVEFVPPAGRELTDQDQGGDDALDSDPDPATNRTDVITLDPGENDDTVDAGIAPLPASLGDKVWEDTNENGLDDDGANGVAGVTVELLDATGTNVLDSDVTDANGIYGFTGLDAGTYVVRFVEPADRDFTSQDTGADDTIDSDADTTTGETAPVTLAAGEDNPTIDAGLTPIPEPVGSISDFVWEDLDGDGIQDAGEPGVEGVTVTLLDAAGDPILGIDPVQTDSNGNYIFADLPAGDYIVEFTPPTGRELTAQDAGDGTNDSDPNPTTNRTDVITLAAGENNVDVDAGIAPLASLGDKVWEDTNQNGLDDDGANGVEGVVVNLLDENGVELDSTTTDADGLYGFTDLLSGTYVVEVELPAGRAFTSQDIGGDDTIDSDVDTTTGETGDIVLDPGEDDPTNDAGLLPLGSISDFVWEDLNGDGIQDAGEPGVEGVTVRLLDTAGEPIAGIADQVTDSNGNYLFDDLPAGDYIVEFVAPTDREFTLQDEGVDDTVDSDASPSGRTGVITLGAAEDNEDVDAGIAPILASLGDYVWEDLDGDGIQDVGEPPVEGVVVNLFTGAGADTGQSTTTDASGLYTFDDLLAGDYIVEFEAPAGQEFTLQDTPGDDTADSDVDPSTGRTGVITLDPGEDDPTNDAGLLPLGSISDFVWDDLDGDGIQDAGEPGVEGVNVELLDGSGNPIAGIPATTTDANGNYSFDELPAGDYIVRFTAPTGTTFTVQDADDGTNDSDPNPATGETAVITLGAGEDNEDVDAGLVPLPASLGDLVFEDTNENGIQDGGEPGVPGVTVELLDAAGDPTGQTDVTDANGIYGFDDLAPGTYVVRFVEPADRDFTSQDTGADDTIDSDADTTTGETAPVTLAAGEDNPTIDAGLTPIPEPVGSISDFVWEDLDGDGIQDAGEPGVEGVTVTLLDAAGDPILGIDPVQTDSNGNYIFADLPAGDYIVEFTPPTGRELTAQDAGDGTNDSDPNPTTNRTDVITLAAGENNVDVDAGIAPLLASLGDFVWEDLNGDGIQDAGEPPVEGVLVTLLDGSGATTGQTDTTDVNGLYGFDDLLAGDYIVEFEAPAGREFTLQDQGGDDTVDSDVDPATSRTGVVTLDPGENDPTIDAGIAPLLGSISDFVWEDLNGDGIQDTGEPGIEGVVVNLLDGSGNELDSTTTDDNGLYSFDDLLEGDYIVEFEPPAGRDFTTPGAGADDTVDSDVDPGTNRTGIIPLTPGEDNEDVDAGIAPLVPAIGLAKALTDGPTRQGTSDVYDFTYTFVIENLGETELTGVTLSDNVAAGLAGTTGSVVSGPTPNAAGDCSTAVALGTQTLAVGESCTAVWDFEIANPGGAELAFDNSASVEGTPPSGPPVTDTSDDGTEPDTDGDGDADEPGENDPTPALIPALASLGDKVFEDTNEDGIQDVGEPGVGGVSVVLLDGSGASTGRFATTDGAGDYSFEGLDAGDYIVQFTAPTGRDFTLQDQGGDETADSDVDPTTGRTGVITLAAGDDDPTNDAGLTPLPEPVGSISDLVFDDLNGDGIQDPGEPGLAGVTVRLLDDGGNEIATTTTDGDGNYIFGDLPADDYIVEFVAPSGRDFSPQNAGGDDALDSDADPTDGRTAVITLGAGEINDTVDAGIAPLPPGSISDLVFDDLDGDGIQDPGEPGVEGVVVNLLDSSGNPTGETTTTDAGGNYIFDDLVPGNYIVEFVPPAGRDFTTPNAGGDDGVDSDAAPNGRTNVITISPGENDTTVDAGLAPLRAAIGLAKDLTDGPIQNGAGDWVMEFSFVIENLGDVPLTDVGITDDFAAVFAPGTVVSGPTPLTGSCDAADAALGTASLDVGESCTAVWSVTVSGLVPGETYENTATATGTPPSGPPVTDISDDGTMPDGDEDGDADEPGENDPTPITIPLDEQAVIGDKVFLDADGDGIQDPGEAPVEGVVIQVRRPDGTGLVSTTTDADGLWSVTVDPGDWIVAVVLPEGHEFSPQNAGSDDTVDSDIDPETGLSDTVTVEAGDTDLTIDAGLIPLGSLGNRVFLDQNRDGIQDANEPSVPGATVRLYRADADGTKGALVGTQITPADGSYLFENLSAQCYVVVVLPPTGFIVGPQDAGADDAVDNDISPVTGESDVICIGIGENLTTVDAGVVPAPVTPTPTPPVTPSTPRTPPLELPTITNAPGPDPVAAPDTPPSPPLATTGSNGTVLATLAMAMLAMGGTMLTAARRERNRD